jgi:hypothetical protein
LEIAEGKVFTVFPLGTNCERLVSSIGQLENVLLGGADLHLAVIVAARVALELLGRSIGNRPRRQK